MMQGGGTGCRSPRARPLATRGPGRNVTNHSPSLPLHRVKVTAKEACAALAALSAGPHEHNIDQHHFARPPRCSRARTRADRSGSNSASIGLTTRLGISAISSGESLIFKQELGQRESIAPELAAMTSERGRNNVRFAFDNESWSGP